MKHFSVCNTLIAVDFEWINPCLATFFGHTTYFMNLYWSIPSCFFNKCKDFGNNAAKLPIAGMTVAIESKTALKNSRRISRALSEITQKEDHKHKNSKIHRIMTFILSCSP